MCLERQADDLRSLMFDAVQQYMLESSADSSLLVASLLASLSLFTRLAYCPHQSGTKTFLSSGNL